jgi:hypothetical protein
MPLKLSKLENLLFENRLLLKAIYNKNETCIFIKVFSIDTGIFFFISINDDYNFKIKAEDILQRGNGIESYSLDKIVYKEGESIIEKYSAYPSDKEIQTNYEITLKKDFQDAELEANLENNYKKKIFLKDLQKELDLSLKDCIRQLKRLSLSFENIKYSLCIMEDKLFVFSNGQKVKPYFIENQNTESNRLFFVITTLEFFYENPKHIIEDIKDIKIALFSVLDKNSKQNIEKLVFMLSKFDTYGEILKLISSNKRKHLKLVREYENFLLNTQKGEKEVLEEILVMEDNYENGKLNDTNYVHRKRILDEKKTSILKQKQQLLKNLIQLSNYCDNLYLKSDKVDFENIILVDAITKNLQDINKQLQKQIEL